MRGVDVCPYCWSDLRGTEISPASLEAGYYGKWDGVERRWFSRLIGVEYPYDHPEHYDGVSEWMCPDCGARWSRFTNERLDA